MAKVEIVPRKVPPVKIPVDVVLTMTEQEAGAIKALLDTMHYGGSDLIMNLYQTFEKAGIAHGLSQVLERDHCTNFSGQFINKYGKVKED